MKAKQMKLGSPELHEAYEQVLKKVKDAGRDDYDFYHNQNMDELVLDNIIDTNDICIIQKAIMSDVLTVKNANEIKNEHLKHEIIITYPSYIESFCGYLYLSLARTHIWGFIENNKWTDYQVVAISETGEKNNTEIVGTAAAYIVKMLSVHYDKQLKDIYKMINSEIFLSDHDKKVYTLVCKVIEILFRFGCGLPHMVGKPAFGLTPKSAYNLESKLIYKKLNELFSKSNVANITKCIVLEIINGIRDHSYRINTENKLYYPSKGGK